MSTAKADKLGLCCVCESPTTVRCGQCYSSWYCSGRCQSEDWNLHKILCKEYTGLRRCGRQLSPSYKLAILFSAEGQKPELLEVYCGSTEGMQKSQDAVMTRSLASQTFPLSRILCSRARGQSKDEPLQLTFVNESSAKILRPNWSILQVIKGVHDNGWRGPVLAMKMRRNPSDSIWPDDLLLNDFRSLVKYLKGYGNDRSAEVDDKFGTKVWGNDLSIQVDHDLGAKIWGNNRTTQVDKSLKGNVWAVKIYCESGPTSQNYAAVQLRRDHPVFKAQEPEISRLMNTPVRTLRVGLAALPKASPILGVCRHIDLGALYPNLGRSGPSWGYEIEECHVGWPATVVVARSDGGDLTPEQLETLCDFCATLTCSGTTLDDMPGRMPAKLLAMTAEIFQDSFLKFQNVRQHERLSMWQKQSDFHAAASHLGEASGLETAQADEN